MPYSNSTSNLPGMMSEFKDGGLQLRQETVTASTESILILGTATDGPVMEPVAVDSSTAELVFGKSVSQNGKPNGATLPEAFARAYADGCRDIRLMRVSGKSAAASIACATVTDPVSEIKRQNLGLIGGNDEMVFTVSKNPIIGASVTVVGGGRNLSSTRYTVDDATGKVTLKANSVSVGTDIAIKYDYFGVVAVPKESFTATEGQTKFTLANVPLADPALVVKVDGATVATGYTVTDKDIDFTVGLTAGQVVDIAYSYVSTTKNSATENKGADNKQWVAAAAGKQEFELAKMPKPLDSFKLYVDGKEIVPGAGYDVDVTGATPKLLIDKSSFQMGGSIEVAYYFEEANEFTPTIGLETYFGGFAYNETQREVTDITADDGSVVGKKLIITKPRSKRSSIDEAPLEYSTIDFPTLGQLVSAINTDVANGVVEATTDYPDYDSASLLVSAKTNFVGGDDGLNLTKDEMFKALSGTRDASTGLIVKYGAYQILENYQVDYVVPAGIYADDELVGKYDNFAYELALFCAVLSQTHLTHGIIAMRPPQKTGLADVEAYVKKLESYNNDYFMRRTDGSIITDTDGNPFDIGGYISVIAGPDLTFVSSKLGRYNEVGTATYAATNSRLKASSAPTNKKVASAYGIRYNFGVKQLQRLAAKRYVTFQLRSTDNAIIITDGVTAGQANSDYSRLVNIKVVRECLEDIYTVAMPYIGEPPSAVNNNALSSAISKKLDVKMEGGDIDNYGFQLVVDSQDKLIGDSKLELNIVPPGERRRITVVVGLKKSL